MCIVGVWFCEEDEGEEQEKEKREIGGVGCTGEK